MSIRYKSREEINLFKEAKEFYITNNVSAREVGRKFGISKDRITKFLTYEGILRPKLSHTFNEDYFEEIDTEDKAYWLGFIYADGSINPSKNCLEISLKESDKSHLEKFKKSIEYSGEVRTKEVKVKGKTYGACRIELYGEKLIKDLQHKGVYARKSLIITFPSEEQVPKKLLLHFIRGYFDGDGSLYTYHRKGCNRDEYALSIIGTQDFLNGVQNFLISEVNVRKVKLHNQKVTVFEYKKSWNECLKVLDFLYSNAEIYLDRKYEIYKDICPYRK